MCPSTEDRATVRRTGRGRVLLIRIELLKPRKYYSYKIARHHVTRLTRVWTAMTPMSRRVVGILHDHRNTYLIRSVRSTGHSSRGKQCTKYLVNLKQSKAPYWITVGTEPRPHM